jgi:hypothetical protein
MKTIFLILLSFFFVTSIPASNDNYDKRSHKYLLKILKRKLSPHVWRKIDSFGPKSEAPDLVPLLLDRVMENISSGDPNNFYSIHKLLKTYRSLPVSQKLIELLDKADDLKSVFIFSVLRGRVSLPDKDKELLIKQIEKKISRDNWSCRLASVLVATEMNDKKLDQIFIKRLLGKKRETRKRLILLMKKKLKKKYPQAPDIEDDRKNWGHWWVQILKNSGDKIPDFLKIYDGPIEVGNYSKARKPIENITYFSNKIESDHFVLVTDYSLSMAPPCTLDVKLNTMRKKYLENAPEKIKLKKITLNLVSKHEFVVRKQIELISLMPESVHFNLIFFGANVISFKKPDTDVLATLKNKRDAIDFLCHKAALSFGTQLYEGIFEGMKNKDADTVYILTDGRPVKSSVMETGIIMKACYRWQIMRQVIFHTIDLGLIGRGSSKNDFMKEIAENSGGNYSLYKNINNISFYVPE